MDIEATLTEMTQGEKLSLLAGVDMWCTGGVSRLAVPGLHMSDGPAGVRGSDEHMQTPSICMPVGAALGATWNRTLVREVGAALAAQARMRSVEVLLAPTVNIPRAPVGGRNFEFFSEDPYLSGLMAAAYISGLQDNGVAACLKHFVANDQEFQRFSISAEVDERTLHEIYLEPFRLAIEHSAPWCIMTAYNRINGTHASEHRELVAGVLRKKWGYDGVVISDWYGTYSDRIPSGPLDIEMPGPARWMAPEKVMRAMESGELDPDHLDDKVRRILRLVDRVTGARFTGSGEALPDTRELDQVARRAATEAVVLLKNADRCLPLNSGRLKRVLVIGENAKRPQIAGGGSAFVNAAYAVSPLDAIRAALSDSVSVEYQIGTPTHRRLPLIQPDRLRAADGTEGLTLTYYDNLDFAGDPTHISVVSQTELSWFGTVNPYVDPARFSLRLEGTLEVPESGDYELDLFSVGHARLYIDGHIVADAFEGTSDMRSLTATVHLRSGEPVAFLLEYASDPALAWRAVRVGCEPVRATDPVEDAVSAAADADAVVIVAGLTPEWESEGFDRPDMKLVGRQDELISRVAAVNSRTIVVLNCGSPVEMPWASEVPAILQSWYGGQEWGNAVADVLLGSVNPSGKLPTTYPVRLEDTPGYINFPGENGEVHYGERVFVGYRYYDYRKLAPLFPFGHGLSYTTFEYGDITLDSDQLAPGQTIGVSIPVTNSGDRPGSEVVQLYVHDPESRVLRPERELKAFAKVTIEPGRTEDVHLSLDARALAGFDTLIGDWVAEPGRFVLEVGSSSRDIRARAEITYEDPQYRPPDDGRNHMQQSTVAT